MVTERSRVLFLHAGAEMYGADKILLQLVTGIDQAKFNPLVILPSQGPLSIELERRSVEVRILNLGVLRRKYFTPLGILNRTTKLISAGRTLRRLINTEHVALVHSNTSAVLIGGLTASLCGIPHLWHIHEITTRPRMVQRTFSYLIPRLSDIVITVSNAVKMHLLDGDEVNRGKTQVIHNGIDYSPYCDVDGAGVRRELGLVPGEVLVTMIGRVNRWKGQHAFVDVATRILRETQSVRFLLVGGTFTGEEQLFRDLVARVERAGLSGRITVSDYRQDVPQILAASDIFVLPSIEPDPLPTVVLEAMSSAKPVVSFAHGGAVEMVEAGETGFLTPVGDPDAMAEAILRLVRDRELRERMGKKGRIRVHREFSVQAFIARFEQVYARLMSMNAGKTSGNISSPIR